MYLYSVWLYNYFSIIKVTKDVLQPITVNQKCSDHDDEEE